MLSKTSFFNKTVFRKNLTRFAPVWGVYTLCLVLGIFILYGNGGDFKQWHFANNMMDMISIMALVNLGYAALVAQLLFGDLYNSRMCNMLHAFPLRRENWFLTNICSGFVFSLVPTAVMALVCVPLLMGSVFAGAPALAWWLFLASNLQFVCFFGIAVFSAMVVGNRFTMVAGYGLLNAGAYIAYWLIDTVYTPMLYGVITPTQLTDNLTPLSHMMKQYAKTEDYLHKMQEEFGNKLEGAVATFTVTDEWWRLWMLAGVGIVFALLALVLYRKRDLECAGDAVAFKGLVPVFQVLCSVFVAAAAQFFLYSFLGLGEPNYLTLAAGLVVGWFVGKMLLERTSRVFRLKNWYGLAALAAVFAVSLWMTHIDILGIETRLPDADKVKSVYFGNSHSLGHAFEAPEDIEKLIRLQECAVESRVEEYGYYLLGENGEKIYYTGAVMEQIDKENEDGTKYTHAAEVTLRYELESGRLIRRRYNIWVDSEEGRIAKEFLNRWETMDSQSDTINGQKVRTLDLILNNLETIYISRVEDRALLKKVSTRENAEELIEALKADSAAGTLAQHPYFHPGYFRYENEYAEDGYGETSELYISLESKTHGWSVYIYPDSANTIRWLRSHGLLDMEILPGNLPLW